MAFELLAVCGGICGVSTHQIQYISQHIYNICLDTSNILICFFYKGWRKWDNTVQRKLCWKETIIFKIIFIKQM